MPACVWGVMRAEWVIPARSLTLRWALIALGVVILVWTGLEDDRPWVAAALGVSVTGLTLAHGLTGALGGRRLAGGHIAWAWAGFGALTGGLGAFIAVILMTFKDVRHAHPFPDYPVGLLAAMLSRAPGWALAGTLIGMGMYAAWRARTPR